MQQHKYIKSTGKGKPDTKDIHRIPLIGNSRKGKTLMTKSRSMVASRQSGDGRLTTSDGNVLYQDSDDSNYITLYI